MTLPATFPISANQINVELGRSPNAQFNMLGASERALAGVPSGPISMANFLGKSAVTPVPKEASFLHLGAGVSGLNHTYVGVPFGSPTPSRIVVVCVHWAESAIHRTLTGAFIGGVPATIHAQRGHSGGSTGFGAAIISANATGGTSGDVTLGFSGSTSQSSIGVHRLSGFGGISDVKSTESAGTTQALPVSVAVPSAGAVIAAYSGSTGTVATDVAWTSVTERYDSIQGVRVSSTLDSGLPAQTLNLIASQGAIADAGNGLVVTSWG